MQCARILAVTGASGVGKTTIVRAAEARGVPGVSFHYFDSVGVPTPEEMARDYPGPEGWQGAMTDWWIKRLASYLRGQADALGVPVLDTSNRTIEESADALHGHISALAAI